MGMDVDMVFLIKALEDLEKLARDIPHGERKDICDDYLDFKEKMENKYKNSQD